ncbi:MAG: hypothetical protein ACTHMM_10050 [Agriterribacter sp.]
MKEVKLINMTLDPAGNITPAPWSAATGFVKSWDIGEPKEDVIEVRLSIAQIDQLIKQEIIIDSKKHCFLERQKRKALREIARKALMKKHGYE